MKAKKDNEPMVRLLAGTDDARITVFAEPLEKRLDLYWQIDTLLKGVTQCRFQFISVLNDMQEDDYGTTVFKNKTDIPLKIVNLLLEPYGLTIREDDL